jgi:hypothetical protein
MSREEVMAYTQHTRLLRTSPPTMAKQLAADPEIEVDEDAPKRKTPKKVLNTDDFLARLQARATT